MCGRKFSPISKDETEAITKENGMFIVFEGGEGVGKSTQLEWLTQAFENQKIPCVKTREPGGTPFAEKIRSLFKEKTEENPLPMTELFLICAARTQHLEKKILPFLSEKKIVLCDRFLDSTYVYQHFVGNVPKEIIDIPMKMILKNLLPDLTFVLHCRKDLAQKRRQGHSHRQLDRMDTMAESIHNQIAEAYLKIVETRFPYPNDKEPKRVLIDTSGSSHETFEQIKKHIKSELNINL